MRTLLWIVWESVLALAAAAAAVALAGLLLWPFPGAPVQAFFVLVFGIGILLFMALDHFRKEKPW